MITSGALAKAKIAVEPNIKIQKTGAGGGHYHRGPCLLLILALAGTAPCLCLLCVPMAMITTKAPT